MDCHKNYSSRGSVLPGIDTSVWKIGAYMNYQYSSGDNDPVVVYENTEDSNFKRCIISFAGSEMNVGDLGNFFLPWNEGTTGYCGRDGVNIGVRNELWHIITHDEKWSSVIKPQLETCHEVTCAGHSLGGALCSLFTMCANQGEENLGPEDDDGMWDDFQALAWTKAKPEEAAAETSGSNCDDGLTEIIIDIITDDYPEETSWSLTGPNCPDKVANTDYISKYTAQNTAYQHSLCVEAGSYTFEIKDAYGDGMCCSYGRGKYEVTYGGSEKKSGGEFSGSESVDIGSC